MNRIAEEKSARRIQSFDTVLPDEVRVEFTRLKRHRVLGRLQPLNRNTLWLAGAIVFGAIILAVAIGLAGRLATLRPTLDPTRGCRRELAAAPYTPRAELVRLPPPRAQLIRLPEWRIGEERPVMMPYGLEIVARFRGKLQSTSMLPISGNAIGDTWVIGDAAWVWVAAPGAGSANWIDP